jgi:hypothetical protein
LMLGALNWTSEWYRPQKGRSAELVADQALAVLLGGLTARSSRSSGCGPGAHRL